MANSSSEYPPLKGTTRTRLKRFAPKVRTGCLVCRVRRVKCDETRPACIKCTSTGRVCEGYTYQKKSDAIAALGSELVKIRPAALASPESVSACHQDLHIFHMFRIDAVTHISGLYDKGLWNVDLLRATHERPAIWHANLAFAAIYRRRDIRRRGEVYSEQDMNDLYAFSIKHYNAAIQILLSIANQPDQTAADKETILFSEALFIGLNAIQGNLDSAIAHANNVFSLFYNWKFWKHTETTPHGAILNPTSLVALLTNFESQVVHRLDDEIAPRRRIGYELFKPSTEPFRSIEEAYHEFVMLLAAIIATGRSTDHTESHVVIPAPPAFRYHVPHMLSWADKFDALRCSKLSTEEIHSFSYTLLELKALVLRAYSRGDPNDGIYIFDKQVRAFRKVLDALEELVANALNDPSWRVSGFSFSMSICELVCWIALTCKDHDMRVRCVALLRKWPVQDGLWDSRLVASMLEAYMKVEDAPGIRNMAERGCECVYRGFICGRHRILKSSVKFIRDGEANFICETVEDSTLGSGRRVQKIVY